MHNTTRRGNNLRTNRTINENRWREEVRRQVRAIHADLSPVAVLSAPRHVSWHATLVGSAEEAEEAGVIEILSAAMAQRLVDAAERTSSHGYIIRITEFDTWLISDFAVG
jgi:hypothetical protein